ncbi:mage protein [Grosmannia clavigera kw1407]|uniref:Mage protein n=1 Tax=Grosmannia clavigera (strain kw1407 / UAMH 11150) TaxID=655863 RepID=F0XGG8_GROCL|nr:mage protein [Grosmannia clavigera kw1407]EFX03290.1 mage protein [Grosmannia clavigera kw1407]
MSTQSRRPRRRPAAEEPEEEAPRRPRLNHGASQRRPADEEDEDEDMEGGTAAGNADEDDEDEEDDAPQTQADRQELYTNILAKKLIRYALSCEPRRLPIRRQAIKEQVLENQGKNFRKAFPIAQEQLRAIFGMEMVEWPSRDESTMSLRERRKALKTQKPTTATGAATRADRYVLVSTLPDAYRASVFTALPTAALPPAPDSAYIGFVTMVVSLVTLSGGALAQTELEKYLTMLYGARHGPVRADAELLSVASALGDYIDDDDGGTGASHGIDASQHHDTDGTATQGGTLQYLVRHGYLVRVVEASAVDGRGSGGGRSGGPGMSDGAKVTWHVGPRGRLEIGPAEVAAVVRHMYGPAAGDDLERRLKTSLHVTNKDPAAPTDGGNDGREAGAMQEG